MSYPIADVYRLIQKYTTLGQNAYNVLHFAKTAGIGDAAALLGGWFDFFFSEIEALISTDTVLTGTTIENLVDPLDFVIDAYSVLGDAAGETISTFTSHQIEKFSPSKEIRGSGMRIPGPVEEQYTNGVPTVATQALLDAVAIALETPFSASGYPFRMVLFTPGNTKTLGLPLAIDPAGVDWGNLTTQNSRKVRR